MSTVQKFDRSMIERYLKKHNLRYLKDSDGDFRVEFAYDEDMGCELTVWFTAEGTRGDVYRVLIVSDKRISKSDWGRAIMLCNTWNRERRWPKAYLYVSDPNTDTIGRIHLEEQLDLEKGVHQELLDDFTNTIILAANSFWTWAHKEQGL